MKRWVVVFGLLFSLAGTAEANVLDWPVVSQVWRIGSCVVADSGKIVQSAMKHTSMFGVDVLTIVADCAKFIVDTITPGTIPDPHQ